MKETVSGKITQNWKRRGSEEDMKMQWRMVKRATSKQVKEDLKKKKRKGRRLKKEGLRSEV